MEKRLKIIPFLIFFFLLLTRPVFADLVFPSDSARGLAREPRPFIFNISLAFLLNLIINLILVSSLSFFLHIKTSFRRKSIYILALTVGNFLIDILGLLLLPIAITVAKTTLPTQIGGFLLIYLLSGGYSLILNLFLLKLPKLRAFAFAVVLTTLASPLWFRLFGLERYFDSLADFFYLNLMP